MIGITRITRNEIGFQSIGVANDWRLAQITGRYVILDAEDIPINRCRQRVATSGGKTKCDALRRAFPINRCRQRVAACTLLILRSEPIA